MSSAKTKFILAMLIFGSIGVFVKNISLPSIGIVQWRTIIGSGILLLILLVKRPEINMRNIKNNMIPLIIAGIVLGANWAFMFEAFNYTSVSIVTILYYCAPIIVFFVSPILFKEKIRYKQLIGIFAAIFGMIIINSISNGENSLSLGILYALISAVFYALVMITNKFIHGIDGIFTTFIQVFISMLFITIYIFITTEKIIYIPDESDILFILIVGGVHTGLAYILYFGSIKNLTGQNISILSYIDPASALVFAFVFLGEILTFKQVVGTIFILGGTLFSQIKKKPFKRNGVNKYIY